MGNRWIPPKFKCFTSPNAACDERFLCGDDAVSGKSYGHRKQWIRDRLEFLASVFGVDVLTYTQSRGFVIGASFGLPHLSLRRPVLACHAADTACLATWFLFVKLLCVATLFGFGEKRCRKNLPLCDLRVYNNHMNTPDLSGLPVTEKLRIVTQLWDDIASSPDPITVPPEVTREASRRSAELDADPSMAIDDDELWRRVDG